jgi:hypothetical protein
MGSNWVDSNGDELGDTSTAFDVARIRIKISDLSINQTGLINNSKIKLSIKSTKEWCGAGYLRGYVSTELLSAKEAVWYREPTKALKNSTICTLKTANFSWGKGESIVGKEIIFSGTISTTEAVAKGAEYLYIYIIDTVCYYGNPGSTTSRFSDNYLKISFELPYTSVENPGIGADGEEPIISPIIGKDSAGRV